MTRAEWFGQVKVTFIGLGLLSAIPLVLSIIRWDHEWALGSGGLLLACVAGYATTTRIEEKGDVR